MSNPTEIPTMSDDSANANAARAYQRARHELYLALRRWEAMASVPRYLQFPRVGDIAACERAMLNARRRGQAARAERLQGWMEDEYERLERLAEFNQIGRSSIAWNAVAERLVCALADAILVGAATGKSVELVESRISDARLQAKCAALIEQPTYS